MSDLTPSPDTAGVPDRSWLPVAAIVAAVLVVVGVAVGVTYVALQNRPGSGSVDRRAMTVVAVAGIKAMITGDGEALLNLSDDTMQGDFTPALIADMKKSGLKAEFGELTWNSDNFVMLVSTGKGDGVVIGGPVPDGAPVVIYRTMGILGATTGGIELTTTPTGWAISSFVAGNSPPTTSTPSPTGTPSATTTP